MTFQLEHNKFNYPLAEIRDSNNGSRDGRKYTPRSLECLSEASTESLRGSPTSSSFAPSVNKGKKLRGGIVRTIWSVFDTEGPRLDEGEICSWTTKPGERRSDKVRLKRSEEK